jgi:ankyrin repeat protein
MAQPVSNNQENNVNPQLSSPFDQFEKNIHILRNSRLVERYGKSKDTLLHAAIELGINDVATFLIVNLKVVSELVEGISPLYRACRWQRVEIARALLENGADPMQKNDLSYRNWYNKNWILSDVAREHEAVPMKAAAIQGNQDLINLLLKYKAPIDEPDAEGRTPLFIAVDAGHEELALAFIAKDCSRLQIRDCSNTSLLVTAVQRGLLRVVKELVVRGALAAEEKESDCEPLYTAAGEQNAEVLRFLLQTDAKNHINALWRSKWTALSSAVTTGTIENVKMLVEAGADLSIKYNELSILELAKKELKINTAFYNEHPHYHIEAKRVLKNSQDIVDYLQWSSSKT